MKCTCSILAWAKMSIQSIISTHWSGRASTQLGIRTSAELGEFHLYFWAILKYLISKNQMSQAEETWLFLQGLQPDLKNWVKNWLQIIKPNHNPQDPYDLTDLYNVASFVLQGSVPATSQLHLPLALAPAQPKIKTKTQTEIQALKSTFAELTEMFENSMQQSNQRSLVPPPARAAGEAASKCNFCGLPGHFMRECKVAAEYMHLGKCKCSVEGKIVWPAGGVVPWHITGAWLRDHINGYHWINPGQIMAAQMLMELAAPITQEAPAFPKVSQFSVSKVVCFDLKAGQLRVFAYKRQFWPQSPTTAKRKAPQTSARITEVHTNESDGKAGLSKFTWEFPPHVPEPVEPKAQDLIAKHLYVKASGPNANIAEPQPPVLPLLQKNEWAYTTTSNIYDHRVTQKVYDHLLETEVTITQRKLLLLAPKIQTKISDAMARQRITQTNAQAPLEFAEKKERTAEAHMLAAFLMAIRTLLIDVTIIADSYEAFLKTRPSCHDCPEEAIEVAAESNSLQVILPIIDGQKKVKVILDPGCQIVAMSEEVCTALALPYDPDIWLNMVSANGGVNQSLSLTQNVPFLVGWVLHNITQCKPWISVSAKSNFSPQLSPHSVTESLSTQHLLLKWKILSWLSHNVLTLLLLKASLRGKDPTSRVSSCSLLRTLEGASHQIFTKNSSQAVHAIVM